MEPGYQNLYRQLRLLQVLLEAPKHPVDFLRVALVGEGIGKSQFYSVQNQKAYAAAYTLRPAP
jgi:hypothetical protein